MSPTSYQLLHPAIWEEYENKNGGSCNRILRNMVAEVHNTFSLKYYFTTYSDCER